MENNSSDHITAKTGVILMTYGSATVAENVPEYLSHIYRGEVPPESIVDFQKRYRLIGYSPLIDITHAQAAALQEKLGERYTVRSAMLHSTPFIDDVVREFRVAGVEKIIGVILSPQFSSFIMEGYRTALRASAEKHDFSADTVYVAEPWPAESHFVELLAAKISAALKKLAQLHGREIPLIFTTHSLPERVVAKDPTYLNQLQMTTDAVLKKLSEMGETPAEYYSAYQSAGHTPEPWLKPDLVDILKEVVQVKRTAVLIVPIQFLADHLEILYDLDIAGGEQCAEHGIAYNRITLPNTEPLFIDALVSIVISSSN